MFVWKKKWIFQISFDQLSAFLSSPKASAVDGGWSEWSQWSSCSKTCGRGSKVRARSCDSPVPRFGGLQCQGDVEETGDCQLSECPGKLSKLEVASGEGPIVDMIHFCTFFFTL